MAHDLKKKTPKIKLGALEEEEEEKKSIEYEEIYAT